MSGWDDLVTTALLGTGRRPLPESLPEPMAMLSGGLDEPDPARRLLDLAAGFSVVARTQDVTTPEPDRPEAPAVGLPAAPQDADQLLEELLEGGGLWLVNAWLNCCVDHGRVIGARTWPVVITAASRHRLIDRGQLASALGEQGVWFAGLNPDWASLHRALSKARSAKAGPSAASLPPAAATDPTTARKDLEAQDGKQIIDRVVNTPQPWPEAVTRAGLGACCRSGRARIGAKRLDEFAMGMPLSAYPMLRQAADHFLDGPGLDGNGPPSQQSRSRAAALRTAHDVLVLVEGVLHDRIRIAEAFGERPAVGPRTIIHHPARSLP